MSTMSWSATSESILSSSGISFMITSIITFNYDYLLLLKSLFIIIIFSDVAACTAHQQTIIVFNPPLFD